MRLNDRLKALATTTVADNYSSRIARASYKEIIPPLTSYCFCASNAYSHIAKQVSFGPRVPGSYASTQCAKWIIGKLKEYGVVNIQEQHSLLVACNGDSFDAINISAQVNPNVQNRIILISHWDSRPWADNDSNPVNRTTPIDGANDGASGVGVILELARILAHNQPNCGIDILFVDAEDYGQRLDEVREVYDEYSWCLGIQYWIKNPTLDLSKVDFAIILDMVGGNNAIFPREYYSQCLAGLVNDLVWQSAYKAGHTCYFQDKIGGAIIDDHVYFLLNQIPAIVIVESSHPNTGFFNPTWHTLNDTIENIDIETLNAVGETLEQLLRQYYFL